MLLITSLRKELHGRADYSRYVFLNFLILPCLLGVCSCSPSPLANAIKPLATPTYDGSGKATEPSIRLFPAGWHGFSHWMVIAAYPNEDSLKENPSVLVSNDGFDWVLPPGLKNPLALPAVGYFSDSELFYDAASDQLWVYFSWNCCPSSSRIMRMTSSDGVNWSLPEMAFEVDNWQGVTPTVQRLGTTYYMWTVNAGALGCHSLSSHVEYRTSLDGLIWSDPQVTDLAQLGYVIWHIEVAWIDSKQEFWMFLAAYKHKETCGDTVLFYAKSQNGVHWITYKRPALGTGLIWDSGEIYRSGMTYDASLELLRVWYSARDNKTWHVGLTQSNYTQFVDKLQE